MEPGPTVVLPLTPLLYRYGGEIPTEIVTLPAVPEFTIVMESPDTPKPLGIVHVYALLSDFSATAFKSAVANVYVALRTAVTLRP